jgi:hypothetical protein
VAGALFALAAIIGPGALESHATATNNCGPGVAMTCVATAAGAISGTKTEDVVATCTATAAGVVESTAVYCWLYAPGANLTWAAAIGDGTHWTPGAASTTPAVFKDVPIQPYEICIEGGYTPASGQAQNPTNYVCGWPVVD